MLVRYPPFGRSHPWGLGFWQYPGFTKDVPLWWVKTWWRREELLPNLIEEDTRGLRFLVWP